MRCDEMNPTVEEGEEENGGTGGRVSDVVNQSLDGGCGRLGRQSKFS
jgi:hypothetical protein